MRRNYEHDEIFSAAAYIAQGYRGIAWHVLGWETVPDEDTEWSGIEQRTGRVTAIMVGDDRHFTFGPDELTPIEREEYCGVCGQIGCCHDGYDRSEA
jgi:hypothetical protein